VEGNSGVGRVRREVERNQGKGVGGEGDSEGG